MQNTTHTRHRLRRALVVLVAAGTVAALGAQAATAAPAAAQRATSKCWQDVINDWLDNNRVDHRYPIPCYTQAIQHLNAYPDVRQYSNAADDIHRALLAALRNGGGPKSGSHHSGSGPGPTSGTQGGGPPAKSDGNGNGNGKPGSTSTPRSPYSSPIGHVIKSGRPSSALSVPLPLIVLAALALLLLLAGGGTWLLRRVQMRRMVPATEPATGPRSRS
jgi:hypothetical protein